MAINLIDGAESFYVTCTYQNVNYLVHNIFKQEDFFGKRHEEHTLTEEEIPRHSFGVEIYGGKWPDGSIVLHPCIECKMFYCCNFKYNISHHEKCFVKKT